MSGENHWTTFKRSSGAANNFADNFSYLQDLHRGETEGRTGGGGCFECLGYTSSFVRCVARICAARRGELRQRVWIIKPSSAVRFPEGAFSANSHGHSGPGRTVQESG